MRKLLLGLLLMASTALMSTEVDFTENLHPNVYKAYVISVYDGDTFTVHINTWHNTIKVVKIRLLGVDTPEVRGSEKEEGKKVRDYVRRMILNKYIWIYPTTTGKYGRTLAQVEVIVETDEGPDVLDLATHLKLKGYAKAYMDDNVPKKEK